MINHWLWYALGQSGHMLEHVVAENKHVPGDVKRAHYVKYLSHELVPKKLYPSTYRPQDMTKGEAKVWDKLKDVCLNPYYAPLMSKDFKGMPPAYVITADLDVLRDDGIMYAKRLERDGVSVIHKHYHNIYHDTIRKYAQLKIGEKAMDDLVQYLKVKM